MNAPRPASIAIVDGVLMRRCCDCREHLPATTEYFHRETGNAVGLQSRCKKCAQRHQEQVRSRKKGDADQRIAEAALDERCAYMSLNWVRSVYLAHHEDARGIINRAIANLTKERQAVIRSSMLYANQAAIVQRAEDRWPGILDHLCANAHRKTAEHYNISRGSADFLMRNLKYVSSTMADNVDMAVVNEIVAAVAPPVSRVMTPVEAKRYESIHRTTSRKQHRGEYLEITPETTDYLINYGPQRTADHFWVEPEAIKPIMSAVLDRNELPKDTPKERWRWVPTFKQRVCVSTLGRVKVALVTHRSRGKKHAQETPVKYGVLTDAVLGLTTENQRKYPCVYYGRKIAIHHAVLLAFVGPRPSKYHIACHEDDDPSDNRLEKLRWDTPRNNSLDRWRNAADADDEAIRSVYVAAGMTAHQLSVKYGMSLDKISRIKNRKSFEWVTRGLQKGELLNLRKGAWRCALLTEEAVILARKVYNLTRSIAAACAVIGGKIDSKVVANAVYGDTWGHIIDPPPCMGKVPMYKTMGAPVVEDALPGKRGAPYRFAHDGSAPKVVYRSMFGPVPDDAVG